MISRADSFFARLPARWVCLLFMVGAIIPTIFFARFFHIMIVGELPPHVDTVSVLAAICVAAPLVLNTVHSIKKLDRSKKALHDRTSALDETVGQLAEARESLRDANARLEERVRERTAAAVTAREVAEEARAVAEEASKTKSMFLANMSHELRTPLNAIIGFSDMIGQRAELNLPEPEKKMDEYADAIHTSGRHLLALVNDLLDLSRIDCGQFNIVPERLKVKSIVDDVLMNLSHTAGRRNQTIDAEINCASKFFFADARASHQILTNLLSNALKFSDEGSQVTLLIHDDASGTCFEVIDRGIGMTEDHAKAAVLPFSRLSEAHIASGESIGLGLSIVSSLCTLHGSPLELIRNADGVGTTARVRFPNLVTTDGEKLRA